MIIEFSVHISPEQIVIQHSEKGTLLNLRNNAAYDPIKGAIMTLGKSPEELANKLPAEKRAEYLQNTQFTAPFGPQGFLDGLARPVLVYLIEKAQGRYYANRWSNALHVLRDSVKLDLVIDDYAAIDPAQRQAFEDAVAPLWQVTLNGLDLGDLFQQGKTARRTYLWVNLMVLAVMAALLVGLGSLSAELVGPGDTVGVLLSMILIYAAVLVMLYLGSFLSRLVWVLLLRRRVAPAVLKAQLSGDRRLQSGLAFFRIWLENLIDS